MTRSLRIRYCLSKKGAELSPYSSEKLLQFSVLQGFLLNFANFKLEEEPVILRLRCTHESLSNLETLFDEVTKSQEMKWEKETWSWIDVKLNDNIPAEKLKNMIDDSYNILYSELEYRQKMIIDFSDMKFDPFETLKQLTDFNNLAHRSNEVLLLLQPAINFTAKQTATGKIGQSKLGGLPDFPQDWEYPRFGDNPLSFLAQINLSDIPDSLSANLLPDTGILYFFSAWAWIDEQSDFVIPWDESPWDDLSFSRVLYFDGDPDSLLPANPPGGLYIYKEMPIGFSRLWTLPRAASYVREPIVSSLNWSEDDYEKLDELYFDYSYLYQRARNYPPDYHLLGYSAPINVEITKDGECLLLQVDGHLSGNQWADGGVIYFVIGQQDLINNDFSRVRAILDSA